MTEQTDTLQSVLSQKPFTLTKQFYENKQIVLYGAGRLGDMAVKLFEKSNIKISFFVDINVDNNNSLNGYPIYSVNKLRELDPKNTIVLISAFKVPFYQLKSFIQDFTEAEVFTVYDVMYYIDKAYFSNGWYSGEISDEDKENIGDVFNGLADDLSRTTYLNFLNWRISRSEFPTIESEIIPEEEKYHSDISQQSLSVPGVIVDAGAFDLSFSLKSLGKGYPITKCIAFEPDLDSYAYCQSLLAENKVKYKRIQLEPLALAQENGEICFSHGHGLASRLVYEDTALDKVKVTTLSNYFRLNFVDENIIAIKIHIEGAELQSLIGGKDLITKHRPLIMVNCSHNRDGLWAIQRFCLNLTNYTYFMRSHAFYGEGLTFYAVPSPKKEAI